MLRLEIGSPELDLMRPVLHARRGVRIFALHIGKFGNDFDKFERFEMQEFNDMTLPQIRGAGPLRFLLFTCQVCPSFFPAGPNLSQPTLISRDY
jgi:hypothetical protein